MMDLEFKVLELEDQPLLESYFHKSDFPISEYTFTNLYVWNEVRTIKYARYGEGLIFAACYGDKEHYFLPPVGFADFAGITEELLKSGIDDCLPFSVRRVPGGLAEGLDRERFLVEEDPENADYIYTIDDLATLHGRNLSNKRALVKKFTESYKYEYLHYESSMREECVELTDRWFHNKGKDKESCDECSVLKRFLKEYDRLDAFGALLRVDGRAVAFAFGEMLTPDTAVIHFEKADITYTGVYQTINKLFCERELAGRFTYVNREQDLGIAGIRKAKKSYYPHHMGKKYKITLKSS